MAAILGSRSLELSTATPRTVQVNMPNTYNWTGTLNGSPVADVVNDADLGATHSTLTGNVHNVSLVQISGDLDDIADGSTYFRVTSTQRTGATRAANALDSSNDYIRSLVSTKMTVVGSNPTTGIAIDANGIRLYQGGSLKTNLPVSGSPSFSGDISGGSNINITGQGVFSGSNSFSGYSAAIHANTSLSAPIGVMAFSSGASTGYGVYALEGGNGNAIYGYHGGTGSGGYAITASRNNTAGIALRVIGRMSISTTDLVTNLNADLFDGKQNSEYCQGVGTDSGLAIVAGQGFNLNSTISGIRTRTTGNNVVLIENFSDMRLKNDIKKEALGIDFINKLKPVTYRLKSNQSIKYHGFIGQFMKKAMGGISDDSLCRRLDDDMISTDYVSLISPIVKAIQDLSKQINDIKERLDNA